ncbi:hypothetical protein M408DRAFT_332390 [Serendipita vermifera MAFF 305830]|uniref:Uncharacterized protein n=1 Tax=Serendipita vermifera MAFF 305830 TaxID=933852 RepID=A0A0C3AVS3_SERVB|nr:hypothetical protein M408DRAFT_332390 [Serendipita vermifera MAFF 305830]
MTDKIANMRAQATLSLQDRRSQNEDQRLRQHASLMQELRVRQDWAGITRLEQEYKQQESRAKQEEGARGHQEYCQTFLDPARDIIHAGFTELHPLYAELEGILNSDYPDLDVVRALTALEEVSDLMEQGMTDLEALQDDRRNRELESQRLHIIETAGPSNSWGDTSWLENQKKTADIEIKASRTAQKVDRRIAFYTLAQRKLEEAIVGVDHNRDALIAGIQEVLGRFRDVVPLEQEEAQAQAGNLGPSQLPLPSRLAYNQIKDVHAMLVDVDKMCNDMRLFLHNLKYKQVSENRLRDTAQLELSEHQQGRSDSWYFGAGEALRQQAAREDEAATKQFEQEKNERVAGMNGVNELVSAFTKQYIERERAVLRRLANGMTAQGPMDPATASAEGGPAKTAARTLNDIEEMRIVQQQAEILHGRMMVHQSAILGVMTAQAGYSIYNLV